MCLILPHSKFSWGYASYTLEVFAEERGIGEIEFIRYLKDCFVGVYKFHLDACYESAVNPFLGSNTTGLSDNSTKIAFCETEAVCIKTYLMLFGTVLIGKLNKVVEDGLFARL